MNRWLATIRLRYITAFTEGKNLQRRHSDRLEYSDEWTDDNNPDFSIEAYDWRIKPEPREFFIMKISANTYTAYRRDQLGPNPEDDNALIHVYEALDNE